MYLYKKTFVWRDGDNPAKVEVSGGGMEKVKPERIQYVVEEVGYWRKANHIHAWFVDNVQDGVDECQTSYVPPEKLQELLALCRQVLADPGQAEALLPTRSGFFFGGVEYDDAYVEDLVATVKILEEALAEPGGNYEYHSSW